MRLYNFLFSVPQVELEKLRLLCERIIRREKFKVSLIRFYSHGVIRDFPVINIHGDCAFTTTAVETVQQRCFYWLDFITFIVVIVGYSQEYPHLFFFLFVYLILFREIW
jgi:hypothetical protein